MTRGFWDQLPQPIVALSPMDGVTDQPYRFIQKKYGRPDVIFTEFTSAEGLARNATILLNDLIYDESQRPIVAQIFGKEPESFRTAALMACYLGFDGIDINMGCPAKNVSQHGSGAALIKTPELAQAIIRATQAGVQDWVENKALESIPSLKTSTRKLISASHERLPERYRQRHPIPVSVKTRIGYDQPSIETWIPQLLACQPAVISLHGRTLKQLYSGQADWSVIQQATKLIHENSDALVLGNGDITSASIAQNLIAQSGVDGVLVGRGTFGNPWLLRDIIAAREQQNTPPQTLSDLLQVALEHAQVFERDLPQKGFFPMRKNLGWYIKGIPNASQYRTRLVLANSAAEVESILRQVATDAGVPFPAVS